MINVPDRYKNQSVPKFYAREIRNNMVRPVSQGGLSEL